MSTNAVSTMADAVRIASTREALFIVLVVTSIIWRLMDVLVLNCLRGVLAYRRQRTVKLTASKTWTIHFTSYANKMMNLYWPKTDAEIWERAGAIVHKNPESFTTLDPLASFVAIRDLNWVETRPWLAIDPANGLVNRQHAYVSQMFNWTKQFILSETTNPRARYDGQFSFSLSQTPSSRQRSTCTSHLLDWENICRPTMPSAVQDWFQIDWQRHLSLFVFSTMAQSRRTSALRTHR